MNNDQLLQLAQEFGTPTYVFDLDAFSTRADSIKAVLGSNIALCFSIKANPFLVGSLPDVIQKLEVCSPGELTVCEKMGVDMGQVIFSGINKTLEDVSRAMTDSVGVFTAESLLHLRLIDQCARESGKTVPVLLRLTNGSQFGMDESDIEQIVAQRADYAGVVLTGLHYFTGTQKKKASIVCDELDKVDEFSRTLYQRYGFAVRCLEYGPGLGVDYFGPDPDIAEQQLLESVAPRLRQASERYELTVEMGRYFSACCGTYLTRVMDIKCNCGTYYAVLDGGIHQINYDGQIMGMKIPELRLLPSSNGEGPHLDYTLCGSLCTHNDILIRKVSLPELKIGGVLAFCRAGAYSVTEGMALFLSRELPRVFLYAKKYGFKQIRKLTPTDPMNTPAI